VGELRKLGVTVSATSVGNVLRHHGFPPAPRREGPTWSGFLHSHAPFVIEIERRVVHLLGVTTIPKHQWVAQIERILVWDLQEAKRTIRFLMRDRDAGFTAPFGEVLRSEGIEINRTPVRAPRANAFAERWAETVRADCLDHLLIFSHRQLEYVQRCYVEHNNAARPHRGIGPETSRPSLSGHPGSKLQRRDVRDGLIRECRRTA